jgi:hypothetical protein
MSTKRKYRPVNYVAAGSAIGTLAFISPPAAAAATVALGIHEGVKWYRSSGEDESALPPPSEE